MHVESHMMSSRVLFLLLVFLIVDVIVAPPVEKQKDKEKSKDSNEKEEKLDEFGLEYERYLKQVVQALEEDKDFAKKLENISAEEIRSGHIAKELEFVKHNVRSKLDELKRIEIDRLRKLLQQQMEKTELGLYRDEDGHLLNSPDGRRWRTIPKNRVGLEGGDGNFWLGLDRKEVKIPKHLDIENPHSFEIEDLKKLIQTATKDLEELDKQRRENFKKYELEKEAVYRESLVNMTEDQRKEAVKHHEEMIAKHKDHPKVHHPGSKPQLEQVWEDQDHMPKEEFNPRTFFAMHDINGDGHLDVEEVEAILIPEVKKLYNPNNEEDDPVEMEEEFHRMREHVFNETDKDKDGLISLEEFLKMTEQQEFQRDEGWKGLDEQQVYSEDELQQYLQRERQMQGYQQYPYGDPRAYYDVGQAQGLPPHINYQVPPGGVPPSGYPQGQQYGAPMQHGYPQQPYQGVHPQAYPQGAHPQQYQGAPQGYAQQQHQGHGQPQQYQGHGQPQQYQGHGQPQQYQGHGQPQQYQGHGQPQQYQGVPQHPSNSQQYQAIPQQQQINPQQYQGNPQQQYQVNPQQQFQVNSQNVQADGQVQQQQKQGQQEMPSQAPGRAVNQQQNVVQQNLQQPQVPETKKVEASPLSDQKHVSQNSVQNGPVKNQS